MKRVAKLFIGLWAVFGLGVSSVSAACSCSHHRESSIPAHRCHQDTAGAESSNSTATFSMHFDERCICIPQAAKLSVKSEGFKLKKQPASFSVSPAIHAGHFHAGGIPAISFLASSHYRLHFFGAVFSRGPPLA
jgi:hypothetical protein